MARFDRVKLSSSVALALTAACSTSGVRPGDDGSGGVAGHAGHGGATTSTVATTTSSSAIATGTGGLGGAGGGMTSTCDPPPDPSTLWAQKASSYPAAEEITLCPYVGQVLLVVNTAAV
ncbi:Hypothetical protein A7982_10341 [Minicystis rosea]|nr:Hypothetical protein A7982_10341 [Minicystis rosea]